MGTCVSYSYKKEPLSRGEGDRGSVVSWTTVGDGLPRKRDNQFGVNVRKIRPVNVGKDEPII